MTIAPSQTLAEDVLLLAFDDEKPVAPAQRYGRLAAALPAGLIGELSLRGRVRVSEATIRVLDSSATSDDLLDEVLGALASTRELWSPAEWLQLLGERVPVAGEHLIERLVERLVESGGIYLSEQGFIATRQWPLPPDLQSIEDRRVAGRPVSPAEHDRLVAHFQRRRRGLLVQRMHAILLGGDRYDERWRLLISLASAARLLQRLYDRDDFKRMRSSVRTLTADEPLGKAVRLARWTGASRWSGPLVVPGTPPWARY